MIKRNGFDLLEINDEQTGKIILFDMNNSQFIQLQMDVPVISTESSQQFDFSKIPIHQIFLNNQYSQLIQEDSKDVKRLLLKPQNNEEQKK